VFTSWNWTEVGESTVVSIAFVLAPLLWRVEKHRRQSVRQHAEQMAAHAKVHRQLGIEEDS
jgi:methionine salvage enolase-phosphatase E1